MLPEAYCWTYRQDSDEAVWIEVPATDNMAGYGAAVRYSTRGASITHKQVIIWLIRVSGLRTSRAGWSTAVGRLVWHNCTAQHRRDASIIKTSESNVSIPD